ncbi:DM13 domain-containing protein [Arthrobacter sp. A2-55]|uniref:DM13 domain-containing protein n=1 Tax=Arthrobacter sp. A2-55 TaxID=2897337 RepID=UPI0021CD40CF|nr:DM13 domain-containing protein [Arthrobacter sp. A2-55]MCU6481654.1 DM13 domain-containing protein [Arthrobacter sp. A2-55]
MAQRGQPARRQQVGTMKRARPLAIGAILVLIATGCTNPAAETAPSPAVASSSPAPTPTPQASRVLAGTFVSQAVPTRGEVILTEKTDSITLTLQDFSTGPGDEVYIYFNLGRMTKDPAGDNVVEDPNQIQLTHLKSRTGTQNYDLTPRLGNLPKIQSITIYSYKSLEAFGTANLALRN